MRCLVKRSESDGSETKQEKDEHEHEELARRAWSSGEFVPDENTPGGGDHGGALPNGVGDGGSNETGARCDEVGDGAEAPDSSAEDTGNVPA